jgi:hypothetical protein
MNNLSVALDERHMRNRLRVSRGRAPGLTASARIRPSGPKCANGIVPLN